MRSHQELMSDGDESAIPPSEVLVDELGAMAMAFEVTAQRLLPAMTQLILPGAPLPDALLGELIEHRRRFDSVRAKVTRLARALGLDCPPVQTLNNLGQVDALLAVVAETEALHSGLESVRRQALGFLERVQRVTHRTAADDPALRACHNEARRLTAAINGASALDLPADAHLLAEGRHPLSDLIRLIEGGEGLSDRKWEELIDAVGAAFGRGLAASAARGKLVANQVEKSEPSGDDLASLSIADLSILIDEELATSEPSAAPTVMKTSYGKTVSIPRPVPLRSTRKRVASSSELKVERYPN